MYDFEFGGGSVVTLLWDYEKLNGSRKLGKFTILETEFVLFDSYAI